MYVFVSFYRVLIQWTNPESQDTPYFRIICMLLSLGFLLELWMEKISLTSKHKENKIEGGHIATLPFCYLLHKKNFYHEWIQKNIYALNKKKMEWK